MDKSRHLRPLLALCVGTLLFIPAESALGWTPTPATNPGAPGLALETWVSAPNTPEPQSPAFTALLQGRMAEATTLLQQTLAKNPTDGHAHLLLCRVDYAQNLIDPAVNECQAAAANMPAQDPQASDAQLWLGRALGAKASHAGALSAFGIARKVRDAFERAVKLNPANPDAVSDLSEFYIAAPGIVGGGTDKAHDLAKSVASRFPALSHRILALLAEKSGDLKAAESEFKAAAANHSPDALIDLAHFYQAHNRPDDAVATVRQAVAADPSHGPPLVDAAGILTDANREPALAIECLRNYLRSSHQSDSAPVFKAHLTLGRLLAKQGDKPAAKAEFAAAFALAPQYEPARKAASAP